MIDIERAKKTPSAEFETPQDIVEHKHLTKADKAEILLRWKYDELQIEVAQTENMQSDRKSRLREVLNALHRLGA